MKRKIFYAIFAAVVVVLSIWKCEQDMDRAGTALDQCGHTLTQDTPELNQEAWEECMSSRQVAGAQHKAQ